MLRQMERPCQPWPACVPLLVDSTANGRASKPLHRQPPDRCPLALSRRKVWNVFFDYGSEARLTVLWYKHSLGFRWRKTAAIPLPPKKTLDEQIAIQANYLKHTLLPLLGDAKAGRRLVFFGRRS